MARPKSERLSRQATAAFRKGFENAMREAGKRRADLLKPRGLPETNARWIERSIKSKGWQMPKDSARELAVRLLLAGAEWAPLFGLFGEDSKTFLEAGQARAIAVKYAEHVRAKPDAWVGVGTTKKDEILDDLAAYLSFLEKPAHWIDTYPDGSATTSRLGSGTFCALMRLLRSTSHDAKETLSGEIGDRVMLTSRERGK